MEHPLEYASPLLRSYPPLLVNRNFMLVWVANIVSALGDRIHFIVMLTLVTNLMRDKLHEPTYEAGTMESAQLTIMMLLPFVLLGSVTGIVADRFPRRRVMILSDLARMGIVVVARLLFIEGKSFLDPGHLYWILLVSEFVLAIFGAMFSPARTALIPQLVHPDQLLRANSMTNAAGTIASLLGFVMGGFLVDWDLPRAMFVDAGTFLASATILSFTRIPRMAHTPAERRERRAGMVGELREGLGYIRRHRRVMQITLLLLLFWSCGAVILNGLTGIVTRTYGLDIHQYGYFMGVVGSGMIVGAGLVSLFKHGIPKEFGIAWAMVAVGVFLFLFSFQTRWQVGIVFIALAAGSGAVLLVSLETLVQRIVPNYVRGRVMGVKDMITTLGLVGLTAPLALAPNVDNVILILLLVLAIVVAGVGAWLVVYYYRRQPMHAGLAIIVRLARGYLGFWHRFERIGPSLIPGTGPVIVVANHVSGMDPVMLQVSSPRRVIHFMMAREYYEKKPLFWLYKAIGIIPVNRTGNDIASVRTALRTLEDGKVLGLFPEGKITMTGELQQFQNGVAMLVLMSGATVVPACITGSNVHVSFFRDFTRRARLRIRYGRPMRFDQYGKKQRDKETLDKVTAAIREAIETLRRPAVEHRVPIQAKELEQGDHDAIRTAIPAGGSEGKGLQGDGATHQDGG